MTTLKIENGIYMNEKNDIKKNDNYLTYFIIIAIILIVLAIIFPFLVNYFLGDWAKSGTFGDTFGALNALFSGLAFAGVIITILIQKNELNNQRIELQLQRTEMQESRKEFLTNRITNLVYSQLDRFEKCLSELTIEHNGNTYIGNDAISFLNENKDIVYKVHDKSEDDIKNETKDSTIKLLKIYNPNKSQIEKFALNAYNSIEIVKRLIYKTELKIEDLNDIKNLFFVNIGFVNMDVIKRISEICDQENTHLENNDYEEHKLEVGQMFRANIFLKPIIIFYQQCLTTENFSQLKAEWLQTLGRDS